MATLVKRVSLPFFQGKRQSGQSSWGAVRTWKIWDNRTLRAKCQLCVQQSCRENTGGLCRFWVSWRFLQPYFSLKISFSCSVQTFMNCRDLYTFIGSSIRPFMLINLTRLCSESYIIGGMTESCLICFSLFCGQRRGHSETTNKWCVCRAKEGRKVPLHFTREGHHWECVLNWSFISPLKLTSCSERPSMISEISCSLLAIVADSPVPLCPTLPQKTKSTNVKKYNRQKCICNAVQHKDQMNHWKTINSPQCCVYLCRTKPQDNS